MLVLPTVRNKKYKFGLASNGIMSMPNLIKIRPAVLTDTRSVLYADDCLLGCSAIIALMMVAVSTSETSVSLYQTTRLNNTQDSYLYTRRRENLKSRSVPTSRKTHLITATESVR
jgi:hypothetical protein